MFATPRRFRQVLLTALLLSLNVPASQAVEGEDLDVYKLRVTTLWWFSRPTGSFTGTANSGSFDVNRDLHFGDYSTFTGGVDWRFKRKHHLTFSISPVTNSKTAVIDRVITFQGQTFDIGAQVSTEIKSLSFSPGYQYDIIRRNHGFLAIATQVNMLQISARLSGNGTVNGQTAMRTASGSLFAPMPIVGPRVRWYPLHNSSRFFLDGSVQGMYFFGYGNFVSAKGLAGIAVNQHLKVDMGYQMGSRVFVHGGSNEIGVRLTQKGTVAGIEASW